MRHKSGYKKFQKSPAHRRAMFRNMVTSLVLNERIETTAAKAKGVRPVVEKIVRMSQDESLHSKRAVGSFLMDKKAVHKLFTEIAPRFKGRQGGYTRVIRSRIRAGDAAPMALIEFVEKGAEALVKTA